MKTLAEHISHLLTRRDTVAVPGVGVFYACLSSSCGNIDGTVLSAPRRVFRFENVSGRYGSGCLSESVARERRCDIATAGELVSAMASELRRTMDAAGSIEIEGVGTLRTSPFGKGYWLESDEPRILSDITLHPLAADAPALEPEHTEAVAAKASMPPALRYAASWIAAIVGLAVVSLMVDFINRPGESPVAAALGMSRPAETETPVLQSEQTAPLMLVFNTPSDGMSIVEPKAETPAADIARQRNEQTQPAAAGSYYMIVASLANMREANAFIASHAKDNCRLGILEHDGRIRVYAAEGDSFNAAVAAGERSGATNLFEQWWICRR